MADDQDESEAALELSLFSVDAVVKKTTAASRTPNPSSSTSSWWKPTSYRAIAWIEPSYKQSAAPSSAGRNQNRGCRRKLYFPIHTSTLHGPEPQAITIQILSHRRFPFQSSRLVGTAVLPLSKVKMSVQTFLLPIRRDSGEVRGTVEVSARVLWDLGFSGKTEDAVVAKDDSEWAKDGGLSEGVGKSESGTAGGVLPTLGPVFQPTAPPAPLECVASADEALREDDDDGEKGNFLVGLILGALVVLFVGAACRRWRTRSNSPAYRSTKSQFDLDSYMHPLRHDLRSAYV